MSYRDNYFPFKFFIFLSLGHFALLYIDAFLFPSMWKGGIDAFFAVFFACQAYSWWDSKKRELGYWKVMYSIMLFAEQRDWHKNALAFSTGQLSWTLLQHNPYRQKAIVEFIDHIYYFPIPYA